MRCYGRDIKTKYGLYTELTVVTEPIVGRRNAAARAMCASEYRDGRGSLFNVVGVGEGEQDKMW